MRATGVMVLSTTVALACGGVDTPGGSSADASTSDAGSTGDDTSSGGPAPSCGDGVLDPGESCEPALDGSVCAADCAAPAGALLWSSEHDGAASRSDHGFAVAAAEGGVVYVVGDETVEGEGGNIWLARYEPPGALAWSRTLNGTDDGAHQDVARGVAVSGDAVFVTGYSYRPEGGFDVILARFDADGEHQWTRRHDGAASALDQGMAIAADPGGDGVWVAGLVDLGPPTYDDAWIGRWSGDGVLLAEGTNDGGVSGPERAFGIAAFESGGVVVAGTVSVGSETQVQGDDVWVARYERDGAALHPIWTATHDGPAGGLDFDAGHSVAVTPDGDVLVAGYEVPGSQLAALWLARLDGDTGAQRWARTHAEEAPGTAMAYGVAADPRGDGLVVAGFRQPAGAAEDVWVRKYTLGGEELWTRTYDGGGYDIAHGVTVDAHGRVYVAAFTFVEGQSYNAWLGAYAP